MYKLKASLCELVLMQSDNKCAALHVIGTRTSSKKCLLRQQRRSLHPWRHLGAEVWQYYARSALKQCSLGFTTSWTHIMSKEETYNWMRIVCIVSHLTAIVVLARHANVTVVAPILGPGVLHNPVGTTLDTKYHQTCMCEFVNSLHVYSYYNNNTYIHTYIHTYNHTYTHTYIHTYIHTYTHTHTHTHNNPMISFPYFKCINFNYDPSS